MSIIIARITIPPAWADDGCCPLCSVRKLQLVHLDATPDQLVCPACGLAFELEENGDRLNVTYWPIPFREFQNTARDCWLTAAELRLLVQQPAPTPIPTITVPQVARSKPDIPDEMVARANKLSKLGNTPEQIQEILSKSETDPERIRAAKIVTRQISQMEKERQKRKIQVSMGIIGAIVTLCIGTGFFLQRIVLTKQTGAALPLQETLVPDLAKVLHLSTPVVQRNAAPPPGTDIGTFTSSGTINCPSNAAKAAALFGGKAKNWSAPPNSNGWIMMDSSQGNIIYTPAGMTAAYLQLGSNVILVEVAGPAMLSNVFYIAISCP